MMKTASKLFLKYLINGAIYGCVWVGLDQVPVFAGSLLGPAPDGAAAGGGFSPQMPPTIAAPGGFGGQIDSPGTPAGTPGQNGQFGSGPSGQANPGSSTQPPQGSENGNPTPSPAPTFMNGAMPNSSNPFLPSNISPGQITGPLENAYIQSGVPALAAPLMSAVYRPFSLTFFQPNPFQVVPQGGVSLTGIFETDTNINFSPTQPEVGSLYTIMPSVYYSNFDDYGYLSLMADASYSQYDTGNIPAYFDEMGGISAGTYLGTRVFVGAQDFATNGSTPQMTGSPFAFFNGINSYYENIADGEIGLALTPKLTFVQGASDMYVDMGGYGAGIMNLQSLTDTLNYMSNLNFLSVNYTYQQGIMSVFPSFISNGVSGTAMRKLTPTTSFGVGGNGSYYLFQSSPLYNFEMYSYYGTLTHSFTKSISSTLQGGWDVTTLGGQTYQAPMVDLNIGYSGPKVSLGINVGEFQTSGLSYGIEMGPQNTYDALGYLSYKISPLTAFFSSAGYSYYQYYAASTFSNSFFSTLQPEINYNGAILDQADGVSYTPFSWLRASVNYNLIDFSTNIPRETVVDNQFIAMITFSWQFH